MVAGIHLSNEGIVKKIEEEIGLIKGKIKENQGKIILCSRNFITERADGPVHPVGCCYHVEAGIISGEIEVRDFKDIFPESIKTFGVMNSMNMMNLNYGYSPEIVIPVKTKLTTDSLSSDFKFNLEDLEKSEEQGNIGFGKLELIKEEGWCFSEMYPKLDKLDLVIGTKDVNNFMKNTHHPRDVQDFFKLFHRGEIKKRIAKAYHGKRETLANILVQDVAKLCMLDGKIKGIEEGVLKAKRIKGTDYMDTFYSWSPDYLEEKVNEYLNYAGKANRLIDWIKKSLKVGDKIKLIEHHFFDMNVLGISRNVNSEDYLKNLSEKCLPEIETRLEKINSYLSSEKERAGG